MRHTVKIKHDHLLLSAIVQVGIDCSRPDRVVIHLGGHSLFWVFPTKERALKEANRVNTVWGKWLDANRSPRLLKARLAQPIKRKGSAR